MHTKNAEPTELPTLKVMMDAVVRTTGLRTMYLICPKCGADARVNDGGTGQGVYFEMYEDVTKYNITAEVCDWDAEYADFNTDRAEGDYLGEDLLVDIRCGGCGVSLLKAEE